MSLVLPDTSIWIDFIRGNEVAAPLNELIEDGRIVTNDLIHQLSVFENDTHFPPMAGLFGLSLFRDSGTSNPSSPMP